MILPSVRAVRRWQRPWLEGVSGGELEQGRGHTAKVRVRERERERERTHAIRVSGCRKLAALPPAAVINQV